MTVIILALATVKRLSNLNMPRLIPRALQVTADSVTFQPIFEAKNANPYDQYGSMITLRWSEDTCLWPVIPVREHLARTKDRDQRCEKLSVTGKMGPVTAVSNATIAGWL